MPQNPHCHGAKRPQPGEAKPQRPRSDLSEIPTATVPSARNPAKPNRRDRAAVNPQSEIQNPQSEIPTATARSARNIAKPNRRDRAAVNPQSEIPTATARSARNPAKPNRRDRAAVNPQSKAAIFDLDGTLLDTLGDLADAANSMLAESGFPTHPESAYIDFIGNGMSMLVTRALPGSHRDPDTVARCTARYADLYSAGWRNRTAPYPGIPDLLASLASGGWSLGVVSNKPHVFTDLCISHFFPGQFACVLGQRDHIPRKPHPASLLEATQILGAQPENCLYIGDSGVDIETAQRAHIPSIAVLWGFRSRHELEAAGASLFAADAPSLLSLIEKSAPDT